MFLLVFNISPNYLNIRPAYRKSTIPLLPAEIPLIRKLLMNPLGGTGLYLSHEFRQANRSRYASQHVNMIWHTSNHNSFTTCFSCCSANILIKLIANRRYNLLRSVLCGKNYMIMWRCVRFSHIVSHQKGAVH